MAKTDKKEIASAMGVYEPPKPTITLDEKNCPEIKDYNVDQKVDLHIKGKVISVSRERWSKDKRMSATIELDNVKESSTYDDSDDDD